MKEQIVKFGRNNHLIGVYTTGSNENFDRPVAIILNSGVMHRVGACRTSVRVARQLASNGISSFRFDFSGIGDSLSASDELDLELRNVSEAKQAMNLIQKQCAKNRFVLYGLCSGARDAFSAALEDERVIGIVQIDGYAYRNIRHYINHYLPRLMDFTHWSNFVFRRIPRFFARAFKAAEQARDEDMLVRVWPEYPPRKQIEIGYRKLVERGVRFYIIFTGSWIEEYNYKEQFFDMFSKVKFFDLVDLNYMPNASHILTRKEEQDLVVSGVTEWIASLP